MRVLLFALGLLSSAATFATSQESARPNIVFIMADDLGWADVGFHGGNAPTPNLDTLARENLELLQHYVAPVCSPTRSGLLTGRCWSRFGVTSPQNTRCLPWDTVTLPQALKEAGYDTCLLGKWHLGSRPEWGPNSFGFDHAYGSLAGGVSPWNHRYKKGEFSVTWHRDGKLIEEPGHVTDLITAEAVKWIGQRNERPFFLDVPFTAVHLPLKEPPAWVKRVADSITGEVPRHYAASVMHLDDSVGQIVAALQRAGKRENTLLIFTSDNGGSTAENNDLKYPDDDCPNGRLVGNNLPLRGQKGSVYEGGTRVPTIVAWPARRLSGKVETPVQITDWMPTLCRLAGSQPERALKWDGIDISPLLLGGSPLPARAIYTVGPNWRERSLRLGDWKLVTRGEGDARKVELYNIALDASETQDRAKTEPARLQQLLSELDRVSADDRDAVVAP
jgi:arylsulfatase A-like enzyme